MKQLNSLLRHTRYLADVVVSLADPNVDDKEKTLMILKLMKYPYSEDISYFDIKTPDTRDDIIIDKNTQLHELVGKNSWYLFHPES